MSLDSIEVHSWTYQLQTHKLFIQGLLNEEPGLQSSGQDQYLLCECRGDLFVWSPTHHCLFTTNLKRLHTQQLQTQRDCEEIYQKLHPTLAPITQPTQISSSLYGQYIALIGTNYVNVLELRRQRGPEGEFAGGVSEADCRTVSIGGSLIRAHCLKVLQARWHPEDDKTIAILTSDDMIRLYHLSQPSIPVLTLNLMPGLAYQRRHSVTLDEDNEIVSFCLSGDAIFLLQKSLDIQTILLKEGACPSISLPMYPLVDNNYSWSGCDMLLLPTQPPVLVIASVDGHILHCVYVKNGDTDEDNDDIISVVECVEISKQTDHMKLKLIPDPCAHNNYCILTSHNIYYIHIPWLTHLQNCSEEMPKFTPTPPCTVNQILDIDDDKIIDDSLIISDGLLGEAMIAIYNNGSCWCLKNNYQRSFIEPYTIVTGETEQYTPVSNELFEHINSILSTSQQYAVNKPQGTDSQKDCFEYLQNSIKILQRCYLIPQAKANSILKGRIRLITERYQRQVNNLMSIEEEIDIEENERTQIKAKLTQRQRKCIELTKRTERILSQIVSLSPVLSESEKAMSKDIQSISEKLKGLDKLLQTARSKIRLEEMKSTMKMQNSQLNKKNLDVVISSISEDGQSIKELIQTVKQLQSYAEISSE